MLLTASALAHLLKIKSWRKRGLRGGGGGGGGGKGQEGRLGEGRLSLLTHLIPLPHEAAGLHGDKVLVAASVVDEGDLVVLVPDVKQTRRKASVHHK